MSSALSARAQVAVIGGTGFYQIEGLTDLEEARISTPFGDPSDAIAIGTLEGVRVAFLPRHGVGHRLLPSEVPARANIYALKLLGVERIISVSAVGSLREDIKPLHLVVPDQLMDRTRGRPSTFFGGGLVAHVAFADPFCPVLWEALFLGAQEAGAIVHAGGNSLVIEGPSFSSRAESLLYRSWGADLIGMTALPEAKLAREAEICYAILACVADYDCWHDEYASVNTALVLSNLNRNVETAKKVVRLALRNLPATRDCACADALQNAIATAPEHVPPELKQKLEPIIGRYMRPKG